MLKAKMAGNPVLPDCVADDLRNVPQRPVRPSHLPILRGVPQDSGWDRLLKIASLSLSPLEHSESALV